jgi:acyl-CoA synthetase (AMP-forming)/AMP-acid ligase II/enoyl-CoA hydratase/carnithine racemase
MRGNFLADLDQVRSFASYVLDHVDDHGDRLAVVNGLTKKSLSYRELGRLVRGFAGALIKRGLRKGQVVAVVAPNDIYYPIYVLGIAFAGGTFTTMNPLATAEEKGKLLRLTGANRVIIAPQGLSGLGEALRGLEVFVTAPVAGYECCLDLMEETALDAEIQIDYANDDLGLMFSSGTSGLAKAVMLTNRNFVAATMQVRSAKHFDRPDVMLAALPFFHIYGLVTYVGNALCNGSTLIVANGADFEQLLDIISKHRVTLAPVVAPIAQLLAKHQLVDHFDLTSLRLVISGASPISAETLDAASRRLGIPVVNAWGLTETTTVGAIVDMDGAPAIQGSVGRLFPGLDIKVADAATGRIMQTGDLGEIFLRGPNVMKGYFNDELATSEAISDGWLRTGDVGKVTPDGNVVIVDRAKEFIKYKGFQISPAELEAVLISHPSVVDVGVVGSPDAESGEVPKAFVVTSSHVAQQELYDYVAERVTPYKKVRDIEFVLSIPKTPAGKILRRVLLQGEREAIARKIETQERLEDRIILGRAGPILKICLDRPRKMNAFDKEMFVALGKAIAILEDDPSLRVGVLYANGLVFSSGLDTTSAGPLAARKELKIPSDAVDLLEIQTDARRRTKPMVAAVHGRCLNLGMELAAACDIVIAAKSAIFAQKEVARGLFPFGSGTVNLPPKIGLGNTMYYILTADEFVATVAHDIGLVQQVVEEDELLPAALRVASKIAANAPLGIVGALASIRTMREEGPRAALKVLPEVAAKLTSSDDFKEGVAAFYEKRDPVFQGR